jgi:hypothetical protein
MKLFYIALFPKQCLEDSKPLDEFSIFSNGLFSSAFNSSTINLLRFVSCTVIKKLSESPKDSPEDTVVTCIRDEKFLLYSCPAEYGIFVVITDHLYPAEVSRRILYKMVSEKARHVQPYFDLYKDVNNDNLFHIKQDLETTKSILHNTIEKLFERGERLDDLVDKSKELSNSTKTFYRRAKKHNRWCPWFFNF